MHKIGATQMTNRQKRRRKQKIKEAILVSLYSTFCGVIALTLVVWGFMGAQL